MTENSGVKDRVNAMIVLRGERYNVFLNFARTGKIKPQIHRVLARDLHTCEGGSPWLERGITPPSSGGVVDDVDESGGLRLPVAMQDLAYAIKLACCGCYPAYARTSARATKLLTALTFSARRVRDHQHPSHIRTP